MRNVQDLVNSMNANNKDKSIFYELIGDTIVKTQDGENDVRLISFKNKTEKILTGFEELDLETRKSIYHFLAYSNRDEWFKKFGIEEFEELCKQLIESVKAGYRCEYYPDKVVLMVGLIAMRAEFKRDGSFEVYNSYEKEELKILNIFIQSTDWAKLMENNKDVLGVGK